VNRTIDEPGDRDGAELDEAKEEEQVKAGFLAVGRGGSHRWEMAGLVMNEVGKLSPCHIVLLNVFQVGPWYGDLRLSWSNSHTRCQDRLRKQIIDLSFLLSFLKPGTCVRDTRFPSLRLHCTLVVLLRLQYAPPPSICICFELYNVPSSVAGETRAGALGMTIE